MGRTASRSSTGLMNIGMWEGSPKDVAGDTRQSKKRGFSKAEWEGSSEDIKHDTQRSEVGLKGGGMAKKSMASWEASKEDLKQDKKLAKKHGLTFDQWENSAMDQKHDRQQSAKGLRGGGIATRGMGAAYSHGGSVCKAGGGMVTPKGAGKARAKSCRVS